MSINSGEFLGRGRDDSHRNSDVDAAWFAQHHTLGPKANQASPGNHDHDGVTSKVVKARWFDYTSAWLATTTNPTLGNGTLTAKYSKFGFLTHFKIKLVVGSTSTIGTGTQYYFRLPDDGVVDAAPIGRVTLWDQSLNAYYFYDARIAVTGADPYDLMIMQSNTGAYCNPTAPFTFAAGDWIVVQGAYESAEA